ncbi:hypothetical protein OWR29_26135 [Actinoplanes sp. Pm04-4]|uniref:Uncharacterized protein n=1 Tax=Paractinoplanes pyxinae TaxID=2997416 RepID=A0ABT4B4S3_9ACTN|nr:hypothetical protein [Actinoplanes pyxinae]MCY1141491.1 hypothetical protein [Actinoplanes pyxinae]
MTGTPPPASRRALYVVFAVAGGVAELVIAALVSVAAAAETENAGGWLVANGATVAVAPALSVAAAVLAPHHQQRSLTLARAAICWALARTCGLLAVVWVLLIRAGGDTTPAWTTGVLLFAAAALTLTARGQRRYLPPAKPHPHACSASAGEQTSAVPAAVRHGWPQALGRWAICIAVAMALTATLQNLGAPVVIRLIAASAVGVACFAVRDIRWTRR